MNSRLSPEEKEVEALKAECTDTGCKIQSLQAETESIRALVRYTIDTPLIQDQHIIDRIRTGSLPQLIRCVMASCRNAVWRTH